MAPVKDEKITGYPWWDSHRLREAERGKLAEGITPTQQEFCSLVRNVSIILGSTHDPDIDAGNIIVGSALFHVDANTEFDPMWIRGQEKHKVDLVNLKLPVPRMALKLPETAEYLCFKSGKDFGPVTLNTSRLLPAVDWSVPAEVESADPWVFYGEALR
jgi:hypothetical protein